MATMTLGEFRKLTENMSDDAKLTIRIDSKGGYIHPCAGYCVTGYGLDYDNGPFDTPTGINLHHIAEDHLPRL